eukprot:CAMPEP_0117482632 /NCGR_PEP_ID=MMETSP0784-20121206/13520_1 /TAXON_ID=39447 /ORGANISM="" /LENGTH=1095 /DNA_ID=CAMNT_0005277135 /DNA_START=44 /DNA_END=3331 /DNA_ORIENTATION=+
MRAAKAVRGQYEACNSVVDKLERHVQESDGTLVPYILQRLCPMVKSVIDELCTKHPENPSVSAALWLLEQCGAHLTLLNEIKRWVDAGNGVLTPFWEQQPAMQNGHCGEAISNGFDALREEASCTVTSMEPGSLIVRQPPGKRSDECPRRRPRHSILRSVTTFVTDPASPKPTAKIKQKRVSIAVCATQELEKLKLTRSDDPITEDEEDNSEFDEEALCDSEQSTMAALRGSAQMHRRLSGQMGVQGSLGTDEKRAVQNLRDNKRRFSIAASTTKLSIPPREETLALLREAPMFQGYSEQDLDKIIDIAECNQYECDENVVSVGCQSEALHIVVDGVGKVCVPQQVGRYTRGDCFGDESLRLAGAVCPRQVEAVGGPITTLSIPAAKFNQLNLNKRHLEKSKSEKKARARPAYSSEEELPARGASNGISRDSGRPLITNYEQTEADRELVIMAVKNNKVLGDVLQLSDHQYELIADAVHLISMPKGETLMRRGDHGKALYILQEGLMDVHLGDGKTEGEFKIRAGDSFGELALLYDTPRAATIVALRDSVLWVLDRPEFNLVTRMNYCARIQTYSELISQIPCLATAFDGSNRDMLAGVLEEVFVLQGEEICREGEDIGLLFVIYEGDCEVLKNGEFQRKLPQGSWIGETQLEKALPANETVVVKSEHATVLVLDRASFLMVSKAVESMQKTGSDAVPRSSMIHDECHKHFASANRYLAQVEKEQYADQFLKRRMSRSAHRRRTSSTFKRMSAGRCPEAEAAKARSYDLSSLKSVGVLGEGAFGSVLLMSNAETKEFCAMKVLLKEHIVKENLGSLVSNERSVMALLSSDFIVRLYRTYQDRKHVFFLIEPVLGGELFDVFMDHDLFGRMGHAKFYAGCVTLGLQHLHIHRIVYRDLKLENCLLDERGYLKLTDMGIAKLVMGKTYTVCGTADYFAPETLKQTGYNRAVDWWACGVLLFIMASGRSPFDAPEVTQIYKNIVKGFSKVKFPSNFASDLIDTIKALCRKKPEERVPMQKGGVDNLMLMPFFTGIDWDSMAARQAPPPFTPPKPDYEKILARKSTRDIDLCIKTVADWDGVLITDSSVSQRFSTAIVT